MDIMLLQIMPKEFDPSFEGGYYAPIGIAYVAESLRSANYSVEINTISWPLINDVSPTLDQYIERIQPKLIGFSATGNELPELCELSTFVRNKYPMLPIIAGGYCSLNSQEVFLNTEVDYIVIGEGEETMLELCEFLIKPHSKEINCIKGIAYKDLKGHIIYNPSRPAIKDINHLPVPVYPNYPHNSTIIRVYASRGCPYRCTFCKIKDYFETPTVRYHSENYIIELISKIKSPLTNIIYFNDDEFLLSKSHFFRMVRVARHFGLSICFQTRSQDIVRYSEVLMQNTDVIHQIHMGIESFSQSQLDRWKKDTTVYENVRATEILSQMDCSYYPYIILSDAHTTLQELEENCKYLVKLPLSPYQIEIKGQTHIINLSPLHYGIHLNRMKEFNGKIERKQETQYLEYVWEFLNRTEKDYEEIIKLIRHASIVNPNKVKPLSDLIDFRIMIIPEIAKTNNSILQNYVDYFHDKANDACLYYKAQYLLNSNVFTNEIESTN